MNKNIKILVGCDHAGFGHKSKIIEWLKKNNYTVVDYGTDSTDSVDYPDYVHPIAKAIENNEAEKGILLCGSANGVAMTANKYANIRAAICWNKELAILARQHNNANIICLPARFITVDEAIENIQAFLNTGFEGGRHERRVDKISLI